jgi:NAD(P)-dependent dehydrogenase (short-subunit alcohol dehydrogenase family)
MGALEGRVCAITGAGRGIGREHALLFASEGARLVVNDLGGAPDGSGADVSAAQAVVDEIAAAGGEAVAHAEDISTWDGARTLTETAVDAFGRLDVLVNNAGILRDAYIGSMSEEQWDAVINVHLKGHFAALRHAVDHWKGRSKSGEEVKAAVVNTASASGTFMPNPGQVNYGAAKAAIAAMTLVAAAELGRYGVRVNGIAPVARTRLTLATPGPIGEMFKAPVDPDAFDPFDPRHVSPLVAWLSTEDCPATGELFAVQGGSIQKLSGWKAGEGISTEGDWTIDQIAAQLGGAKTPAARA